MTVGEWLVSNQVDSFWRNTFCADEEKPSGLFLTGFQKILSDMWGNLGGSRWGKYHLKALITLKSGLKLLASSSPSKAFIIFPDHTMGFFCVCLL